MEEIIKSIIVNYKNDNHLELVDFTLENHINNIIKIITDRIENIDNYYEETEHYTYLPLKVRKVFYLELKSFLEPYFTKIKNQISKLDSIPLVNQREEGWYAFRNELISASSIHKVMQYKGKPNLLFLEKIGISMPFIQNEAIIHGIIFEVVSQSIYESRNNIKIKEYGCIPDDDYDFIGASPDGVVHDLNDEKEYDVFQLILYGRLLEIKNPSSRKITNNIKPEYASQINAQQKVCKLPVCDFLETKFNTYDNIDDFFNCKLPDCNIENNFNNYIPVGNLSSNYCEKGILLKFRQDKNYKSVLYPLNKYYIRKEIEEWIEIEIEKFKEQGYEFEQSIYWQLSEYSVKTVKYDKSKWDTLYVKSKQLWEDVLIYRKYTDEEIIKKIDYDLEYIDDSIKNEKPKNTKYKLRNLQKKKEPLLIIKSNNSYNF